MRPWMIVLLSAVGAIALAAGFALPELLNASGAEIGARFLPHLPALAVAAFGAYALCAMLLTTATLLAGVLQVRHHFEPTISSGGPSQRDWLVALGSGGFRQLAARLSPVAAQSAKSDGGIELEPGLSANEIRSEITRLQYISLARSHFFSALIMLAGVVALGLAQDHAPLPFLLSAVPTASAVLVLVGLLLLAILGRIAIDVTAEPLLEAISHAPAERVEVRLLRRAIELLETVGNAMRPRADRAPASTSNLPERLVAIIEQGHRGLLDAVGSLSANTQSLGVAMRSSVETLEATMRTIAAQRPVSGSNGLPDAGGLLELQSTIAELTAVLQRLSAPSEEGFEKRPPGDEGAHRLPAPRVATELRKLLQEIEATC